MGIPKLKNSYISHETGESYRDAVRRAVESQGFPVETARMMLSTALPDSPPAVIYQQNLADTLAAEFDRQNCHGSSYEKQQWRAEVRLALGPDVRLPRRKFCSKFVKGRRRRVVKAKLAPNIYAARIFEADDPGNPKSGGAA